MDKEINQKGKSSVSPTLLTPCRPIGLRRKRSVVRNTNSPSLNSTPVNTNSLKTSILTDQIAPVENVQDNMGQSSVKNDLENAERKIMKRRSTSLAGSRYIRRKIATTNASKTSTVPSKDTFSDGDGENALFNREGNCRITTDTFRDEDNSGSDISQLHSENVSEEHLAIRVITAVEVNALKERIMSKEKKLKELELATLYKKKHDPKQVAKEIDCWLRGCKEALGDLQSELAKRGQSYSLTQLLNTLGIPPSLVDIDEDNSE